MYVFFYNRETESESFVGIVAGLDAAYKWFEDVVDDVGAYAYAAVADIKYSRAAVVGRANFDGTFFTVFERIGYYLVQYRRQHHLVGEYLRPVAKLVVDGYLDVALTCLLDVFLTDAVQYCADIHSLLVNRRPADDYVVVFLDGVDGCNKASRAVPYAVGIFAQAVAVFRYLN